MVGAIYQEFGSTPFLDVDNSILLSVEAAKNLFKTPNYPALVVVAESPDKVEPLMETIEDIYGNDVDIISPLTIVKHVRSIMDNFQVFLVIVASISLLVAGIGIINTMVMSVMERTREIGVLRALGFSQRHIALIFLTEATLIGVIGGVAGILLGIMLSTSMGGIFQGMVPREITYRPLITPTLILTSFLFAVIVGLLSGLYPAVKAAKMDPVQALRSE